MFMTVQIPPLVHHPSIAPSVRGFPQRRRFSLPRLCNSDLRRFADPGMVSFKVDWTTPPRPPQEFFDKLTGLPDQDKLVPRMKCNLYYYRTNYLLLLLLTFSGAFLRNIGALVAIAVCALGCFCLNDTFATSLRCHSMHPHPAAAGDKKTSRALSLAPYRRCRACSEASQFSSM